MEENINTGQGTQTENMGSNTDVQGTAAKDNAGKLFTQEEVNKFVQSRVERLRGQIEKESKAAYDQKFTELQERENRLLVKEKLSERGMSKELADIITCTDENDLNAKLDALQRIYGGNATEKTSNTTGDTHGMGFKIGAAYEEGQMPYVDPVRKAMGLDRKEG